MFYTCDNVQNMAMIQIRNVPDDLHRRLKSRAAEAGLTLSEYLLRMAEREANRPTIDELSERIRRRGRFALGESSADIVRAMRDAAG
jgi:plasmid stability protein